MNDRVPEHQREGMGARLVNHAAQLADSLRLDGVTVRAWRESETFFAGLGFIPFGDANRDQLHPRRLWRPL